MLENRPLPRKFPWIRLLLPVLVLQAGLISGQDEGPVIRSKVRQIFVPVTVTSQAGEPVTDLKRSEFHLLEDGIEQEIINLAKEEVPLNVVFLMDISHSTFLELGAIKNAIRAFFQGLSAEDRVSMVTFSDEARLILDWCNDSSRLERALDRATPKGSTVWYDALYVTLKDLLADVRGKKVVVSVTDGMDTGSLTGYQEILELATSGDVQVYIVSKTAALKDYYEYLKKEYGGQYDETALMKMMYSCEAEIRKLCHETGGRVIDPRASSNLSQIYRDLVKELRMQYYLSYSPFNATRDGQYRKITVRVDRMAVRIHHRPGFIAK